MIEQHLKAGVRYLWTKPRDGTPGAPATAGTLVPSVGAASNLTYDGLDGHRDVIDPVLLQVNAREALGLSMGDHVPYVWLDYTPGHTACVPIGDRDILTGYMSGCMIVRGTYEEQMSAFHVGTVDYNPEISRTVRHRFADELPPDAVGFDPAGAWTPDEIASILTRLVETSNPRVFALVTTTGEFYSLLLFNVMVDGQFNNPTGQSYWCVGGIKLVPPLSRAELMARLTA